MRHLAFGLAGAAALLAAAPAIAQSNPLSSIFACNNANNRQGTGAVVGGLLGGVVGNQVAGDDDRTLGTVLGAALGAAVGSYAGCQMNGADTSQAEAATLNALNENRSTTWSNAQTGASGRVDIVRSFDRNQVSSRTPDYGDQNGQYRDQYDDRRDDRGYSYQQPTMRDVQFARGVQNANNLQMDGATYTTRGAVNLRAGPSTRTQVLGQLRAGERFDTVARVGNTAWLLVVRDNRAVGYVSESVVRYVGPTQGRTNQYAGGYNGNAGYNNGNDGRYGDQRYEQASLTCRTFDQTTQFRSQGRTSQPSTQRFTACQNDRGQWVMES